MKIKFIPLFFLIIFLAIFFVFYKGLQISNIYTPEDNYEKNIPSFNTKIFGTDNKINSEKIFLDGKYYLLNIWASWCVPCRDEHPFLMNLNTYKNIEIIGLNYKDDNYNAQKFLKEFNSPYELILFDKDGTIAIEWGAYGVPESFLIYNNKIIKKIIGPLDKNSLDEIKRIIK
tara:strand:- start:582 stop:1100 length:519 start_codon:yes stop_codon:yes gene_type:complete